MEKKYLSPQALSLLDELEYPGHETFWKFVIKTNNQTQKENYKMDDQAGITINIPFHCFRHSYTPIQLTLGTDIYILFTELGHMSLENIERYAKTVDSRKKEAANKIPIMEITVY